VAEVAKHLNDSGIYVIAALVSPIAAERQNARTIIGASRFVEVHLATPLAVCEARDPKQLYKKARAGAIGDFTGVSAPYELSPAYDLVVDTSTMGLEAATGALLKRLTI
jgi:adenylylsulfate kinase